MKNSKKVITIILSVILWIVILLAALFAFTTLATRDQNKVASVFGFTPLTVQSESMAPFFNSGDMIVIKSCDPADLAVGDVITFHTIIENEYALNTHRIADIQEQDGIRSYTTKGDNNSMSDMHIISDGDIIGEYQFKLPYMGKVIDFLSSSIGFLLVIVLPLLLFFVYQVYHLIVVSINLKKAIALETAEQVGEDKKAQAEQALADKEAAEKAKAEAEAALAEAKRLREEVEAKLAQAQTQDAQKEKTTENKD